MRWYLREQFAARGRESAARVQQLDAEAGHPRDQITCDKAKVFIILLGTVTFVAGFLFIYAKYSKSDAENGSKTSLPMLIFGVIVYTIVIALIIMLIYSFVHRFILRRK